MIAFILKRLAVAIPTLLVLIILSFILMKVAPGSPFSGEKAIPQTVMNNILARYGLDKPEWQQLLEIASGTFLPRYRRTDRRPWMVSSTPAA
jgi:oligopeptide transport system permease protein